MFKKYFTIILIAPFFWSLFGGMSIAGMWSVGEIGIPIQVKAGSFIVGEEKLEPNSGLLMFDEDIGIKNTIPVSFEVIAELLFDFDERTLKFGSGFIKFGDSVNFQSPITSQFITNKFSDYPCDNTTDRKTNNELKHWHYLAIGFGVGGWFVIFCLQILPLLIHTQRWS